MESSTNTDELSTDHPLDFFSFRAYFRRLRQFHAEEDARHAVALVERQRQEATISEKELAREKILRERKFQDEQSIQRVHDTLNEVGLSITLTSITTTFAFCLGCYSSIPSIRWLCLYSAAAIVFGFLYQVSFTMALMVLDERRISGTLWKNPHTGEYPGWIQGMARHFCYFGCSRWCSKCWTDQAAECGEAVDSDQMADPVISCEEEGEFFMDRFMRWYASQILRPPVRVLVVIFFLVFFCLNVWSTTHLQQEFNVEDYVPKDRYVAIGLSDSLRRCDAPLPQIAHNFPPYFGSYCQPFLHALNEYSGIVAPVAVYFRGQDQSDPIIQEQMRKFMADLAELPQFAQPAEACWVRDLYMVMSVDDDEMNEIAKTSRLTGSLDDSQITQLAFLTDTLRGENNFTFYEKLNLILNIPGLRDIYGYVCVVVDSNLLFQRSVKVRLDEGRGNSATLKAQHCSLLLF